MSEVCDYSRWERVVLGDGNDGKPNAQVVALIGASPGSRLGRASRQITLWHTGAVIGWPNLEGSV